MHVLSQSDSIPESNVGFRLQRLEVLNWGTFDQKVHILKLDGRTALLTGENGSGKSTLVDVLLTLLVPNTKRNYNLAAGAGGKRERSEKTYVRGAWGSEARADDGAATTKFLRETGRMSVLLACFANQPEERVVTIAQLLWISDDKVEKLFLIADSERTIKEHLSKLTPPVKLLRKSLRENGFEHYETFTDYAERTVALLKMESKTTLDLFNQTVSIKEIRDVSTFIRDHMLDRLDIASCLESLQKHYSDLLRCWEAIRKAEEQLKVLDPISQQAQERSVLEKQLSDCENVRRLLPGFCAHRLSELLVKEISDLEKQREELKPRLKKSADELAALRETEAELRAAVKDDEPGRRLDFLQKQLAEYEEKESERHTRSDTFHDRLRQLGISSEVTLESQFSDRQTWANTERSNSKNRIEELLTQISKTKSLIESTVEEQRSTREDIEYLRTHKDLIPAEQRRIRTLISRETGIGVASLPFAGELMEVKAECQAWRGALERLLRGFGISLLVRDDAFGVVARFVNANNLQGHLVFHKVHANRSGARYEAGDAGRVLEKLNLKPDHPLSSWLLGELRSHFNYICHEDITAFEQSSGYALTKEGLIRKGATRHIKDDSRAVNDPTFWVLGWSTEDKIRVLESKLRQLEIRLQELNRGLKEKQSQYDSAFKRNELLTQLAVVQAFHDIDWRTVETGIQEIRRQIQELEASSQRLRKLKEQLEEIRVKIKDHEEEHKKLEQLDWGFERDIAERRKTRTQQMTIYEQFVNEDVFVIVPAVEAIKPINQISFANHADWRSEVDGELVTQSKSIGNRIQEKTRIIQRHMTVFREKYPAESLDLMDHIDFLPEFLRLKTSIEQQDLPRHRERFGILMNQEICTDMSLFSEKLNAHCEEMRQRIHNLNTVLASIDYTPYSYIEICADATRDPEIRAFRGELNNCLSGTIAADELAKQAAFERIRKLIEKLKQEERWTARVIDTRNWLAFSVRELDRKDKQTLNYYADTSGKSGGQKAKLAFTILASAIGYQYGIAQDLNNPHSFRFVVIDEMFAKSDDANSRYALQLFRQFQLQLLIVCPFDAKARVVDDYVSSYHLVVNPNTQCSTIRTVTVEEFHNALRTQEVKADVAN